MMLFEPGSLIFLMSFGLSTGCNFLLWCICLEARRSVNMTISTSRENYSNGACLFLPFIDVPGGREF
jgi:hypothetical protein